MNDLIKQEEFKLKKLQTELNKINVKREKNEEKADTILSKKLRDVASWKFTLTTIADREELGEDFHPDTMESVFMNLGTIFSEVTEESSVKTVTLFDP